MSRKQKSATGKTAKTVKEEPGKDSTSKRVNFDNMSEKKFDKRWRPRKPKSGSKPGEDESGDKDAKPRTHSANDFSWYARNPELLDGATRMGSAYIAGSEPINTSGIALPAVLSYLYTPYLPLNANVVRQAMDSEYSFVMHANSRNYTYAPADQWLMQIAGMQIISAIGLGIRVYGLMTEFTGENQYLPEALVRASGFDYTDLKDKYDRMYFDINRLIAASRQLWIPNVFPLLDRWFWMTTKVFVDSESIKDQYYLFNPTYFLKLELTADKKGTSLSPKYWGINPATTGTWTAENFFFKTPYTVDTGAYPLGKRTWTQYVAFVEDLFTPILGSTDRGVIYADLLRAFGADNLFALSSIPLDYKTEFAYEPEVLTQLMNATLTPCMPTVWSNFQSGQNLIMANSKISSDNGGIIIPQPNFLNFKFPGNPSPESLVTATRLTTLGYELANSTGKFAIRPLAAGTEVVNAIVSWFNKWSSSSGSTLMNDTYTAYEYYMIQNGAPSQLLSFDWRPNGVSSTAKALPSLDSLPTADYSNPYSDKSLMPDSFACEAENIFYISSDSLKRLHEVCVLSEMGMPMDISHIKQTTTAKA